MSAFVGRFARRSGDVLQVDIGVDFLVATIQFIFRESRLPLEELGQALHHTFDRRTLAIRLATEGACGQH
jgi:hypothetical protein